VQDGGLFAGNEDLLVGEKPSVFEDFAVKVIDPVKQGEGVAVCLVSFHDRIPQVYIGLGDGTIGGCRRIFRIKW